LTAIVLSAVAYFFAYLLLRRFDGSVPLASLAALIFTFPNNLYLESFHPQCFAVYYIPIIAYCGLLAVTELHQRLVRAYLLGAFTAGMYGVLFSTAYYIAWFFGLGLLIFTPIAGYTAWPQLRTWWRQHPTRVLGLVLVASLGFIAALSIFLIIYAPVLATGVKRSFAEYLNDAPQIIDIVNVGTNNIIWSRLIRSLRLINDDRLADPELSIALTPVVQVLLLASAILAIRPRFWPTGDLGRISRAFVLAGASVWALFYLVMIETHECFFISTSLCDHAGRERDQDAISRPDRCEPVCRNSDRIDTRSAHSIVIVKTPHIDALEATVRFNRVSFARRH
jgi:hypothetical protein